MFKKKRKQQKTRLSNRNLLTTLNDLLRALNPVLPKSQQLAPVNTTADLYTLRQRLANLRVEMAPEPTPKNFVPTREVVPASIIQALSVIATNVWRARKKLVDPNTGEAKEETKRVHRHIEAICEALRQIGIEIIDKQGQPYDSGMALKVITFEKISGLTREKVAETIKPTITYTGRLIQIGEIIVGTPEIL